MNATTSKRRPGLRRFLLALELSWVGSVGVALAFVIALGRGWTGVMLLLFTEAGVVAVVAGSITSLLIAPFVFWSFRNRNWVRYDVTLFALISTGLLAAVVADVETMGLGMWILVSAIALLVIGAAGDVPSAVENLS